MPQKPRTKKALGQNFLRDQAVVDHMISKSMVPENSNVMEIGCGDGFLTQSILGQTQCSKLTVFEIDDEWVGFVRKKISDPRLKIKCVNILDVNWKNLEQDKPLTLLANLPYQITFPILYKIQENKNLFRNGVVMVQEEVAQKLVAKTGRNSTAVSMFLQHHLKFELLDKVPPSSFEPAPKVFSRTVYLEPINQKELPDGFWKFVKDCFKAPRQTIKNNLKKAGYSEDKIKNISEELLSKRAQQLEKDKLYEIFKIF